MSSLEGVCKTYDLSHFFHYIVTLFFHHIMYSYWLMYSDAASKEDCVRIPYTRTRATQENSLRYVFGLINHLIYFIIYSLNSPYAELSYILQGIQSKEVEQHVLMLHHIFGTIEFELVRTGKIMVMYIHTSGGFRTATTQEKTELCERRISVAVGWFHISNFGRTFLAQKEMI
ncbi:hypothetical protein ACJX0J_010288 [Zea mays]